MIEYCIRPAEWCNDQVHSVRVVIKCGILSELTACWNPTEPLTMLTTANNVPSKAFDTMGQYS